ncbi:MAG: site-specific integrase [Paludibacter sp.]|nr:site-specific integrase [Paludibacter sp.]
MATLKIVLDKSHPTEDGLYSVRLRFSASRKYSDYTPNVYVKLEDWDDENKTVLPGDPKFKSKNKVLEKYFEAAEDYIEDLVKKERNVSDAKELRDNFFVEEKTVMFFDVMIEFSETVTGKTRECYDWTYRALETYTNGKKLYFDDITPAWLEKFDSYCMLLGNKVNTRGIHFRNIRKVFNFAIDDRKISADLYPFRRFKISTEETASRSLTLYEFKTIMTYRGILQEDWARDIFLLSFYLIGINMKDLFGLNDILEQKIEYRRYKTQKLFNVTIEPEALEIIERYRGDESLLKFSDDFMHHENFRKKVNRYLKQMTGKINKKIIKENAKPGAVKKELVREFTSYWARHTWGTFAGEINIPEKVISMGLGHESEGNKTTKIYTKFNHKKIVKANRAVIDYVHGVKKSEIKKEIATLNSMTISIDDDYGI